MTIFVIFALFILWSFYVQMLIALVDSKNYNWFKVVTCCRWKLRSFIRSNINRDAHNVKEGQAVNKGPEASIFPAVGDHIQSPMMMTGVRT